jgi:hypothetical protein
MELHQETGAYVFREQTRRPFEQFRIEASRALLQGLSGLVTTHYWEGPTCHVSTWGTRSTVTYNFGEIVCRVEIAPWIIGFLRDKILSDIGAVTQDVAGRVSSHNSDVFIVHGHDAVRRNELQRLIESFGLRPIVLDQQDDRGMTIIEKFEHYASSSGFAFVLMTPDDRGHPGEGDREYQFRARQNVIMELGWFMARLGRKRVVLLHKGEVEIPSDISGIVYIRFERSVYEVAQRIRQRLKGEGLIA